LWRPYYRLHSLIFMTVSLNDRSFLIHNGVKKLLLNNIFALRYSGVAEWFACWTCDQQVFFFFSGLHHYECVAPLVANSLQSGRFWTRSTAPVHDSPWESMSFCTVFIQVICGRPGGLFQYTEGEEVKICLASTLSSIRAICPNRVRRRVWIISVSRGWLVWRRTSSLEMK